MCDAKIPLMLLTLAAGYGVLVLASRQERPLDKLGRLLGGLILLVSFIGSICTGWCRLSAMRGKCDIAGSKTMSCHLPSEPVEPAAEPSTQPASAVPQ